MTFLVYFKKETNVFLGDNLLAWLVLAFGGALAAGNLMALIKPPESPDEGSLKKAPLKRSIIQIALGLVASVWALATLIS